MRATEVVLSSGDRFWVNAPLEEVVTSLNTRRLARLGSRYVNGSQVAQVLVTECPSIFTPETLVTEPETLEAA